jgi:hypothetical protein
LHHGRHASHRVRAKQLRHQPDASLSGCPRIDGDVEVMVGRKVPLDARETGRGGRGTKEKKESREVKVVTV